MTPHPQQEYIITEDQILEIIHFFSMPEHSMDESDYQAEKDLLSAIRSRKTPAPAAPERRSTNEFLELLERTNCDERCKYFHSDICDQKCICQISHDIVAEHDATIRKDERERVYTRLDSLAYQDFENGSKTPVVDWPDIENLFAELKSLRTQEHQR